MNFRTFSSDLARLQLKSLVNSNRSESPLLVGNERRVSMLEM